MEFTFSTVLSSSRWHVLTTRLFGPTTSRAQSRTCSSLGRALTNGVAPAERSGLNDAGQVVFGLTTKFTDNTSRYGIAIWSPTLKLLCASSRKSQGGKNFDVDLPLTGKLGVECRSGGAQGNFTLVLRFTNKLKSVGIASVTTGDGLRFRHANDQREHDDGEPDRRRQCSEDHRHFE